jgi:hypothetical protein
MKNNLLWYSENVLPENLGDVFPKFKWGWIDARTFSEPLGRKTKSSVFLIEQGVFIYFFEARNYKEITYNKLTT